MTTATVRISASTYEQLRELAAQTGQSMQSLMEEAISIYRRRLSKRAKKKSPPPETTKQTEAGFDELADDPNALAFRNLDADFLRENAGKFVAICRGQLVALAPDRAELLKRVRSEHPGEPFLVKRVSKEERVAYFRRPRRMVKMKAGGHDG